MGKLARLILIGLSMLIPAIAFSPTVHVRLLGYVYPLRFEYILLLLLLPLWLIQSVKTKAKIKFGPFWPAMAIYLLACLASTIYGFFVRGSVKNPAYAVLILLKIMEHYVIFLLAINIIKKKSHIRLCVILWLLASIIVAIYGFFDNPVGPQGLTGRFDRGWYFQQSNHMGGFLVMSFILAICLAMGNVPKTKKVLPSSALPFLLIIILITYSRITYLSFFAGLLILGILRYKKLLYVILAGLMIFLVIIPVLSPHSYLGFRGRTLLAQALSFSTDTRDPADSASSHRQRIKDTFDRLPQHLILGEGMGARPLWQYDSQLAFVPGSTGIIGAGAFLYLIFSIVSALFKIYREIYDRHVKIVVIAAIVSFCAMLIQGIATISFFVVLIAGPLWFLIGLAVAIRDIDKIREASY